MNAPRCTYRLQLRPGFGFADCARVAPYLAALGVSHIYASPIFRARPGSEHGYDVCDPTDLNPELAPEGVPPAEAFKNCFNVIKQAGLAWLQDIVPNHMAVTGHNPALVDLLENGEASRFHPFFDIDWQHPLESIRGRMLAPFLGGFYGDTLERGEIRLGFDAAGFFVRYHDLRLPLRLDSYARILTLGLERLRDALGREAPEYVKLLGILYTIKGLPQEDPQQERYYQIQFIKRMLHELQEQSEAVREHIRRNLDVFNGEDTEDRPGNRFDLLNTLLNEQYFRLSFWKVAGEEINYRRFFSINDLISLRVEDERVFRQTHALILDYVQRGFFAGLRVDHIDGLYDPSAYCKRLRDQAPDAYLVVEKILMAEEPLPAFWPIQGTTGYDFTSLICRLFVPPDLASAFDALYKGHAVRRPSLTRLIARNKRKILESHMAGDVENLARQVNRVSSLDRRGFDITLLSLKRAISELMINFPVYRTYISFDAFRPADLAYIRSAIRLTRRKNPELAAELDFLERFLILDFDESSPEEDRRLWIQFVMRFQQFTGPLMAKGVEDTTFYVMNRLLCLNEVGSDPGDFGLEPAAVHSALLERRRHWPQTMNATATHDTKRGEDARLRLAALAQLPAAFQTALKSFRLPRPARQPAETGSAPLRVDPNDAYFLFQTLLATWPCQESGPESPDGATYRERIRAYMIKALREGKERSSWISPDLDYEARVLDLVDRLLKPGRSAFRKGFLPLQQHTARLGMLYSLGQLLCKLTAPGVPDIYQGCEFWDLSLVDPDNRRPVDFAARERALAELQADFAAAPRELLPRLLAAPENGWVKLFTLWRTLNARAAAEELFRQGDYSPLHCQGPHAEALFGYTRHLESQTALVLFPCRTPGLHNEIFPLTPAWGEYWRETRCRTDPEDLLQPGTLLRNAYTDATLRVPEQGLPVAQLLEGFPVALWLTAIPA